MAEALAGFAGGLLVLGIGTRSCVRAGAMRPSPALRSVQAGWFPTAFIRALAETGGDGPWSFAGCDRDARAGSPRPVDVAWGHAAAAAPFMPRSTPPLAMAGSQRVPVVRTAWS